MQSNSFRRPAATIFAIFALVAALALPAYAKEGKPTVVIIRAEWCTACQKLEPAMMELMKQYGDRLNFVVLDVSNDEKLAEAAKTARKLGLSKFLRDNQKKTSTVAIFGKGRRVLFQTTMNFDREAYVKAFDEAIAKG